VKSNLLLYHDADRKKDVSLILRFLAASSYRLRLPNGFGRIAVLALLIELQDCSPQPRHLHAPLPTAIDRGAARLQFTASQLSSLPLSSSFGRALAVTAGTDSLRTPPPLRSRHYDDNRETYEASPTDYTRATGISRSNTISYARSPRSENPAAPWEEGVQARILGRQREGGLQTTQQTSIAAVPTAAPSRAFVGIMRGFCSFRWRMFWCRESAELMRTSGRCRVSCRPPLPSWICTPVSK
jgi:hypothetical protein